MKTHTSGFKAGIKQYGRRIYTKVIYQNNGETVELGKEELNSASLHYEGAILKSVMRQLDIDSNVEIPKGTELNCQFGIKVDGEIEYLNLGNFIVYEIEQQKDTRSYLLTCYDKMLYSMKDYENMSIAYPVTVREYLTSLASYLGLTFKNNNDTFANYDKIIQFEKYLDTDGNAIGYTFRDVLDELAQVTASTICINEDDDQLEVRYITSSSDTIDEEFLKDVNVSFGEKYGPINTIVLSRSADADKIYRSYPENLPDEEKVAIEIKDNQIMNGNDRDEYLPDILNKLLGLEYYLNDFSSTGIVYYNLCDKYNVQIGENTYECVMFNNEINITQGLEERVYTDMPVNAETDYTKSDTTDRRINQTYLIVDKQNQTIESVVTNVTEQNNKISEITQTVDEINSKISDIADITISGESSYATFTLDNINESEPIQIKVKPITDNISYLYPFNGLYPSSDLYPKVRKIRFHNNTTGTDVDYELPGDLLIYDSETYDEFYLDYNSHTCQITKRCEYNADGTVSALASEQVINYEYPSIILADGDYTLTLLGYDIGYLFIRLMAKNIYTSQFYTKAETESRINQKASEIELGVDQTLTNYSTTAQMNSAINIKANEITSSVSETYATKSTTNTLSSRISQTAKGISLNVSNGSTTSGITITMTKEDGTTTTTSGTIQMTGLVKFSDLSGSGTTTINGSNITTGTISANRVSGGTLQGTTIIANSGTIGGWNISNVQLQKTTGNYSFEIRTDRAASEPALLVYDGANSRYNWYVRPDGYMYARNVNISGTVNATSGSFTGAVNATSGTFKGTVQAGSGYIGDWSISSGALHSSGTYGGSSYSVYLYPWGVQATRGGSTSITFWWNL